MYCGKCGAELTEGDGFCPNCGRKAPQFVPKADSGELSVPIAKKSGPGRMLVAIIAAVAVVCVAAVAAFAVPRLFAQPSIEGTWTLSGSATAGGTTLLYPNVTLEVADGRFDLSAAGQVGGGMRIFGLGTGDPIDMTLSGACERTGETDTELTYSLSFDGITPSDGMMSSLRSQYGLTEEEATSFTSQLQEAVSQMNQSDVQLHVPKSGIDDTFGDGEWALSIATGGERVYLVADLDADSSQATFGIRNDTAGDSTAGQFSWIQDGDDRIALSTATIVGNEAISIDLAIEFDPA